MIYLLINNNNMKHLLNNLTDEEKDSIREQHEGGMKVMNENFHKMVNKKLGHVNLYEQTSVPTAEDIKNILQQFDFKDVEISKDKNGKDYISNGYHKFGPNVFSLGMSAPEAGKPHCISIEEMKSFDYAVKVCATNRNQFKKDLTVAISDLVEAYKKNQLSVTSSSYPESASSGYENVGAAVR